MTLDEYSEMITDFDSFMRKNGYVRVAEYAEKLGVKPGTVRGWITAGKFNKTDVITIGNVNYIVLDAKKPTKDREKRGSRKGKYSYDTR